MQESRSPVTWTAIDHPSNEPPLTEAIKGRKPNFVEPAFPLQVSSNKAGIWDVIGIRTGSADLARRHLDSRLRGPRTLTDSMAFQSHGQEYARGYQLQDLPAKSAVSTPSLWKAVVLRPPTVPIPPSSDRR